MARRATFPFHRCFRLRPPGFGGQIAAVPLPHRYATGEESERRTVVLMSEDKAGAHDTLIGCYYFYEK